MAWIESHQSLLTHRKTIRASTQLGITRYLLIGHLHALWWWGMDNAKDDGDLGQTSPEELAEACGWPARKAKEFVAALMNAGFLDETASGIKLHNWYRYAGKLNEKKAKDRLRKAESAGKSTGTPGEVAERSQAPTYLPAIPTRPTDLTDPDSGPLDVLAMTFGKFGKVTPGTASAIEETVKDYGLEWTQRALKAAAAGGFEGQPPWSYVDSICERWKAQGGPDEDKSKFQPSRKIARSGPVDTSANAAARAEARLNS